VGFPLLFKGTPRAVPDKSTDLSWEGEEPSTAAAEENPSPAIEESAPLPKAETVASGAEATPPEATEVEGT
jgi:hypothetical protein